MSDFVKRWTDTIAKLPSATTPSPPSQDDTAALLRALRAERVVEYAGTNYRAKAADLITTQATRIAALEAALAEMRRIEEAALEVIRTCSYEKPPHSDAIDELRAALDRHLSITELK